MTDRIQVAAAALVRGGHDWALLSARRTEPEHLRGGWEFPGGKVEPGEDFETALAREIDEELGVQIELLAKVPGPLVDGGWPMTDRYALQVFVCRIADGAEPQLREQHDELRWLTEEDLLSVAWLEVDLPPLAAVRHWLAVNWS